MVSSDPKRAETMPSVGGNTHDNTAVGTSDGRTMKLSGEYEAVLRGHKEGAEVPDLRRRFGAL